MRYSRYSPCNKYFFESGNEIQDYVGVDKFKQFEVMQDKIVLEAFKDEEQYASDERVVILSKQYAEDTFDNFIEPIVFVSSQPYERRKEHRNRMLTRQHLVHDDPPQLSEKIEAARKKDVEFIERMMEQWEK